MKSAPLTLPYRSLQLALLFLLLCSPSFGQRLPEPAKAQSPLQVTPTATPEQVHAYSYAMGREFARGFAVHNVPIDSAAYLRGFFAMMDGLSNPFSPEERAALIEAVDTQVHQLRLQEADARRARGAAFKTTFLEQPGAQETASGLAFRVIREGSGAAVADHERVHMMLDLRLPTGLELKLPGTPGPMGYKLGQDQPGLTEALRAMRVGSIHEVVIPPELAFGALGAPQVPPEATLVCRIEVLGVPAEAYERPEGAPAPPSMGTGPLSLTTGRPDR